MPCGRQTNYTTPRQTTPCASSRTHEAMLNHMYAYSKAEHPTSAHSTTTMPTVDTESVPPKSDKRTLRVLLTGFGPFRDVEVNPSWLAVSKLNNQTLTFTPPPNPPAHPHAPKPRPRVPVEAHISVLEIPVTYNAILNTIPPLHASKQYDVILHVGVDV
ncbi:hypothetical protein FRC08_018028 [Ceratobasidium sp. 394]|nr:hypothetical protein FRC08_018028 [Ceratobasidium sp. 394]